MTSMNRIKIVHALARADIQPGELGLAGAPMIVRDGNGDQCYYEIGALIRRRGDDKADDSTNNIDHANVMRMAVHMLGLYPTDCQPRSWAERFLWESGARPYLVVPSHRDWALRLYRERMTMNVSEWQPAQGVRESPGDWCEG